MSCLKKISAEVIADSINTHGDRITTFLLTYPRFIHAELMTHRVFSRNSASSRAIPFEKMVKMVEEDPFIPIAWQRKHSGMQGSEYITDENDFGAIQCCIEDWLEARDNAINMAHSLHSLDVTKQLCNRLLEPFMWHTVLVTATEYDNFFELRCPQYTVNWYPSRRPEALEPTQTSFKSRKDAIKYTEGECYNWKEQDWRDSNESQAEIHIQALAEAMWDQLQISKPKELQAGEWHIPFLDTFDNFSDLPESSSAKDLSVDFDRNDIKIATAKCARLSYMTFDGEIDYEKDIELHDRLLESHHMSPFEHCCKCPKNPINDEFLGWEKGFTHCDIDDNLWSGNVKGWIQYRQII